MFLTTRQRVAQEASYLCSSFDTQGCRGGVTKKKRWKTLHALTRATNTIRALDLCPASLHAPDLAVTSAYATVTSALAYVMSAYDAIFELLSKETRLGLVLTSHVDTALATPGSRGRGSFGGSRSFLASGSQSSGGSAFRPNECAFCHTTDHCLLTCPIRVCKNYRQRGPSHYRSDCPHNPTCRDIRPQSTTAIAGVSSTASASPILIDVSDLPVLVQQILSASGNSSTALSASTVVLVLFYYNHMSELNWSLGLVCVASWGMGLSIKAILSPSFTPPYLTDPSIELFLEDVDVPTDLPDDTLHVAPPTIVYPVESLSTDPAPLVLPPVHLPSDLPVHRSIRLPPGSSSSSHRAYDSALFTRQSAHGIVFLLLYVDDMIITRDDVHGISELQDFLHRHFEMKDLGLSYFLGLEVSSGFTGYSLTQAKYASDLLTRAGLSDCKTASTPLEANAHLTSLDGELLSDATLYRQLVGSLIYLTVTRPDIAHVIHLVSQFMSAPRSTHYAAVLRILRYVKGTLFHGLHFSSQSSLQLYAYSNADWAGDPTDRRSTTDFCFFLGDSLISWRSKKQTLVARSSTEAKYRALADTTQELIWLRWLLQDMGVSHSGATVLHCDNRSAILIAHNDIFHDHTKHIEIDCHFIRQHVIRDTVHLLPISSANQTVDIFTKSLLPGRFDALVTKLKLVSAKPP
ncbi:hypothetical protein Acr_17g0013850 [Actinidia rufa]|uniref:Reverse transcriptase Ty1/copia-type domain-containing protein n=1 Tax=Actinidia rufa TaxID=165716 RepID=A0A7J0G4V8_9ERIC|nr:hypothetical protein Acr_17g0013850 [Actinidia rufa]